MPRAGGGRRGLGASGWGGGGRGAGVGWLPVARRGRICARCLRARREEEPGLPLSLQPTSIWVYLKITELSISVSVASRPGRPAATLPACQPGEIPTGPVRGWARRWGSRMASPGDTRAVWDIQIAKMADSARRWFASFEERARLCFSPCGRRSPGGTWVGTDVGQREAKIPEYPWGMLAPTPCTQLHAHACVHTDTCGSISAWVRRGSGAHACVHPSVHSSIHTWVSSSSVHTRVFIPTCVAPSAPG